MSRTYVIASFDDDSVTLRPSMMFGAVSSVRLPRAQMASVHRTFGFWYVETTGGRVYKVRGGIRNDKAPEAFGMEPEPREVDDLAERKAEATRRLEDRKTQIAQIKADGKAKRQAIRDARNERRQGE